MKKILIKIIAIIIPFLFYGCVTQKLTDRQEEFITLNIDFRPYNEKGFLFMPDQYYGEYDVLGIVTVELHPRVEYRDERVFNAPPGYILKYVWNGRSFSTQFIAPINFSSLIDHVYNLSTEWGGDAFTHFKSSIEKGYTDPDKPGTLYLYYSISGIAIKRK